MARDVSGPPLILGRKLINEISPVLLGYRHTCLFVDGLELGICCDSRFKVKLHRKSTVLWPA